MNFAPYVLTQCFKIQNCIRRHNKFLRPIRTYAVVQRNQQSDSHNWKASSHCLVLGRKGRNFIIPSSWRKTMQGKWKILSLNELQRIVTPASSLGLSGVCHFRMSSECDTSSCTQSQWTQPTQFLHHLRTLAGQTVATVFLSALFTNRLTSRSRDLLK